MLMHASCSGDIFNSYLIWMQTGYVQSYSLSIKSQPLSGEITLDYKVNTSLLVAKQQTTASMNSATTNVSAAVWICALSFQHIIQTHTLIICNHIFTPISALCCCKLPPINCILLKGGEQMLVHVYAPMQALKNAYLSGVHSGKSAVIPLKFRRPHRKTENTQRRHSWLLELTSQTELHMCLCQHRFIMGSCACEWCGIFVWFFFFWHCFIQCLFY